MSYMKRTWRILFGGALIAVFCVFGYQLWNTLSQRVGVSPSIQISSIYEHDRIIPVAIVGSGPAGFAAATYAARGALHTVVFEGDLPGGQLMTTTMVENWPGIDKKMGPEIMRDARAQAASFGARLTNETVRHVDVTQWPYTITTNYGRQVKALTIIWATGATPRTLGVPGEQMYWGRGVTTCAVCDAPFYKNERVCVIGGGDAAVEEALELSSYAREVYMFVRRDVMRASAIMQKQLAQRNNIYVWYNTQIREIHGDEHHVTHVNITRDGQNEQMELSGVFLSIGHDPNTALLQDIVDIDDRGYISVDGRSQRTSMPGIYAAGDVEDDTYKQAGVAAGSGIKAALDAADFLRTIGYGEHIEDNVRAHLYEPTIEARRASVPHISSWDEYQEYVLQADKPVIVDFYTKQCPSCLRMMPEFEYVAVQFAHEITCYKVDALNAQDVIQQVGVSGVPYLVAYKNGEPIETYTQALSRNELVALARRMSH